jgi:aspartyl-tRNA(Asn)/glutamyl-tRNA(Gln) amidotransferase subunit B
MEEGSLRCDANVSVRPVGSETLGTKVEIKNVNSFKFIQKAIDYEIRRQVSVIEGGGTIVQETRLFDAQKGVTFSMRSKEEAHDYRYFPDPDLLPIVIVQEKIEELRASLPELPDQRQTRFISEYKLPEYDASVLTASKEIADYFEESLGHFNNPKAVSNWIMTEVMREMKDDEVSGAMPVSPAQLSELLMLIDDGTISGKIAKDVFSEMVATGKTAKEIVGEKGIKQISDRSELETIIADILKNHPGEISRYKGGDEKLMGFFVGKVMKATQGKANPKVVNEILIAELSK